jgi:8-oxo-dGTP pyrophosphatase MutT (NUDIX family)
LLITSRRTGRWIFPKGAVEPDMSPARSAAKEAWEEAGVRGDIGKTSVGVYRTEKVESHASRMIAVDLYPLKVADQARDWPERRTRRRHWATYRQARKLIDNAELIAVLDRLHADLTAPDVNAAPEKSPKRRRQPRKRVRTR